MPRILVTGGSGFIGTNLIDVLLEKHVDFINVDIAVPQKPSHSPHWHKCDILDLNSVLHIFEKFQPTHVIHLAARADTLSSRLEDYEVNTEGTANILKCVATIASVQRLIITSSQFVYGPPGIPQHDEDYKPIGAYGMSKVISEQFTRSARLNCAWTIIRPTNIWGPWHPRYPKEFWLMLKKGLYVHPDGEPTIRSYGYVGNIVYQMMKIIESPLPLVDKKVYYLGDPPIRLLDWVNGFSIAITGKHVRMVPRGLFKVLAAAGSILGTLGVRFPIHLSRYRSMTEDYISPIEPTIVNFGLPLYSLEDGIRETVSWLKSYRSDSFS
jgi:GlcNAc-P-P-Und epimerase